VENANITSPEYNIIIKVCTIAIETNNENLIRYIPDNVLSCNECIDAVCKTINDNVDVLKYIPRNLHSFRLYSVAFQYADILDYYYYDLMANYIFISFDDATDQYFPSDIIKIISEYLIYRSPEDIASLIDRDPTAIRFIYL
jgi:hypothetical protein